MIAAARRRATLVGGVAVLLWATLALLTTAAGPVPPFQLVALTFAVAFLLALAKWMLAARPRGAAAVLAPLRQPARAWFVGVGGLFGYHAFYFTALSHAPAVEASLIAYLWPLLIVLLSALLPGERLRWWHVAGGLMGLAGAALLVTQGRALAFDPAYALGYAAALACAFTWSVYSLLSRRLGAVPTDAVGGFCGATALLGLAGHLLFETTRWPEGTAWLAVLALGAGPVGAAFFAWDHGVKRGDIQALGVFAYAAPLLSTLLLVAFGRAPATPAVAAACLLFVGGALLASRSVLRRRPA
ncbi:MAG: DMT family transporter [Rhodospirillaceae bacterium]|nr:DMT family transporter [Rhodospirillaceae bacterium]